MTSAAATGRRVLAALDEGRRIAIEQAQEQAAYHRQLIVEFALIDIRNGGQRRGRAARIRRKLRGLLTERHIRRVLADIASMSG